MAALHPKDARKRLLEVQRALHQVVKAHPMAVTAAEMFKGATTTRAWRIKTAAKFVAQNILKIDQTRSKATFYYYYAADIEQLKRLVDSEEKIARIIWPLVSPDLLPDELMAELTQPKTEPVQPEAVVEPVLPQPKEPPRVVTGAPRMELPSPPALEGVKQPPPDASAQVVQEWIFTLLHAQMENLIYIREKFDRFDKKISRAVEILEKLL